MTTNRVKQIRRLRRGRRIVEIDCPCCQSTHWMLDPGGLVYCTTLPNKPMFVDGLGVPACTP
jgi:hypothetical protein